MNDLNDNQFNLILNISCKINNVIYIYSEKII